MTGLSVYVFRDYGAAFFFGTPVVIGAVNGYVLNHRRSRSHGSTLAVVSLSMLLSAAALMLFAIEGLLCIAMAAPIALVGGAVGAIAGRAIAVAGGSHPAAFMFCTLPIVSGVEAEVTKTSRFEVMSTIEIQASPAKVWPHVIGFSELPEPTEAIFGAGIAYPKRARIDGSGVGAVRYCEFSTGSFVEPITHWDPPSRLAFDVSAQPFPMDEWSPYRDLHPPHLDGYFRSTAGEFRLIALPGNRTRLEGSTWYDLDLAPGVYWKLYADALVHAIHLRVLEHVKRLSEDTV